MKQYWIAVGAGALLAGCVSPYGWSEAPLDGGYAGSYPVGWWGRDAGSVDDFYGPLSGYGQWVVFGNFGRVFVPAGIAAGWQPYSMGYWRDDVRYGRMWMSSEPWGWATYHYGRWGHDGRIGWFWVPDTRFGPGWVNWGSSNGYASWAPIPPRGWENRWLGAGAGWVTLPGNWSGRPYPGYRPSYRPGTSQPNPPPRPGWQRPDRPGQNQGQNHGHVQGQHPGQGHNQGQGQWQGRPNWQAPGGSGGGSGMAPGYRPSTAGPRPVPPAISRPSIPPPSAAPMREQRQMQTDRPRSEPRGRDVPSRVQDQ